MVQRTNRVEATYIAGHVGMPWNELADDVAKAINLMELDDIVRLPSFRLFYVIEYSHHLPTFLGFTHIFAFWFSRPKSRVLLAQKKKLSRTLVIREIAATGLFISHRRREGRCGLLVFAPPI